MGLQNRLAEQEANISNLKQTLLRVTLAKQSLESEKKELTRRVEEITEERAVEDGRKQNQQQQMDRSVYNEELRVARDAIANLRSSFSDSAPNQHILDTLEQCISVIIEKRQPPNAGGSSKTADSGAPPADNAPSSSRLGSLDYARANNNQEQGKETTTRE